MERDRILYLKKLIKAEGNLNDTAMALAQYSWDFDGEPVILSKHAVKDILSRYILGTLQAEDVHQWAELLELREDIDYMEADEDVLSEILHELANPDLEGVLTIARAKILIARL